MGRAKSITAILLCIAVLLSMFAFTAAAEGPTPEKKPVFILAGTDLSAIDFTGVIEDLASVNTGGLELYNVSGDYVSYTARFFVEENACILRFGACSDLPEDDRFRPQNVPLYGVDFTYTVRPATEGDMLYDGTAAFSFSVHEALDGIAGIKLPTWSPAVSVAEREGETVKKLSLSFSPEWAPSLLLYDRADLSRILTFTADLCFASCDFYGIPISLDPDKGEMIVSLRAEKDSRREGVTMHDLVVEWEDVMESYYCFDVTLPEGLLYRSDDPDFCNPEQSFSVGGAGNIEGLPYHVVLHYTLPKWIDPYVSFVERIYERSDNGLHPLTAILLELPVLIFSLPAFPILRSVHAFVRSYAAYGLGITVLLRGWWDTMIRTMIHTLRNI